MFGERRKHGRLSISRIARIESECGPTAAQECIVTDISESGARLFANQRDIPDRFVLQMESEKDVRQECRVIWRLGGELGVEFVAERSDRVKLVTIEYIRDEARKIFKTNGDN